MIDSEKSSKRIEFKTIEQFLKTGKVDDDIDLSNLSLSQAAAIALRKMATDEEADSQEELKSRQTSREVLKNLSETDLGILDQILNSDIDKGVIVKYLQARGVTEIPFLSTLPAEIRDYFLQFFSTNLIPAEQFKSHMTDFGHVTSDSEIPDWFRDAQAKKKAAAGAERINPIELIRERWFISLVFLLGIMTAVGFKNNYGIELPPLLNQFDLFLSLYGIVTISRSVIQIERAEEWLMETRSQVRGEYTDAFKSLINRAGRADHPDLQRLIGRIEQAGRKSNNWDPYQKEMGLFKEERDDNIAAEYDPQETQEISEATKNPSILDEYNQIMGENVDRETYVNVLSKEIRDRNFGNEVPSVAVVVPTYQTSLEEMERLLRSAKNQAYPVRQVIVVFNDDPNDKFAKTTQSHGMSPQLQINDKQLEFLAFQDLIDRMNGEEGRNDCEIKLFSQGARGKREAMAMGFAYALGKTYVDDLKKKYPEISRNKLRKTIGNLDLAALPEFRHDYILNMDSDTKSRDPFAILNAAILMKKHPDAAATTGDVRVRNRDVNLLTEMTFQRYRNAFFRERAAQKDQVTCDSGPFVLMRQEALSTILEEWYYQEQNGHIRSTYGDDRHLSTLFLRDGWKSLFCPDSAVETDSPIDWKTFIKQQLRWNKSFNRENWIVLQFIHKLSKYDQFDIVYQQTFPAAMLYIIGSIITKGAVETVAAGPVEGAKVIAPYIFSVIMYNEAFFGLYGMLNNEMDKKFLLSPAYVDYHFGALLWLKLRALKEMSITDWGTKGVTGEQVLNEFKKNQGRILLEVHDQIVAEIQNPNFDPDTHTPYDVEDAA